jgi:hypothetical protein
MHTINYLIVGPQTLSGIIKVQFDCTEECPVMN